MRLDPELQPTIHTLWERAAKAKPRDLEIQSRWFSNAVEVGDWKVAQKVGDSLRYTYQTKIIWLGALLIPFFLFSLQAAMSLQHNFPNERCYYFWAIFLSYLIAIDSKSTEAERKLFGTLAYRMVLKAASMTSADTVCWRSIYANAHGFAYWMN